MSDPFRILHDISLGYSPFPYSGIPLGTRILYRILNNLDGIENHSLILGNKMEPFWVKARNKKHRKLQQTLALSSIVEPHIYKHRLLQIWHAIVSSYGTFLKRNFELEKLDMELLSGTVMRLFFEEGDVGVTLDELAEANVYISNLSHPIILNRVINPIKLPTPRLNTHGYDAVILHDVNSIKVSPHTLKIIRYYDFIPLSDPDVVGYSYTNAKKHFLNLMNIIDNGGVLVCINGETAREVEAMFPRLAGRVYTIPYAISSIYYREQNYKLLLDTIMLRQSSYFAKEAAPFKRDKYEKKDSLDYILAVGTLEPRKNWSNLISAFSIVKARLKTDLKLILAGNLGWRYDKIVKYLQPYIRSGEVVFLEGTTNQELRLLYSHARAFVFPSYQEGFGVPPVEAMRCETPVISSDIPVHRWVHGDAAWYVNPYDPLDIANAIIQVLDSRNRARVATLISNGKKQAAQYTVERNTEMWAELFEDLQRKGFLKHHGDLRNR